MEPPFPQSSQRSPLPTSSPCERRAHPITGSHSPCGRASRQPETLTCNMRGRRATIVGGRRLFVTSLGGSPPWRPHRRAQSRRAGVDVCVGDSVSELVARGHAWPLPIRWLTHGAVASTSTTTQILHSWSGTVCHESYIEHSLSNRQN